MSDWRFSCLLLIAIALCLLSTSGDAQRTELNDPLQCSKTCKNKNSVYTYKKGEDYIYEVQSTHQQIHGLDDTVTLNVKSLAHVQVISDCEFALKVEVTSAEDIQQPISANKVDRLQATKQELEGQPLRFGWDDGKITAICPGRQDSLSAANFKRGILSLLQLTMDDLQSPIYHIERDIAGDCYTEYRKETQTATIAVVKKYKNISGCSKRYTYISAAEGRANDPAQEQSQAPLINSEQSCTMTVNVNGPLQSVTCNESHSLQLPFQDQGPRISITQEVRLLRSTPSSKFTSSPAYQTTLLFEQPTELPQLFEDLKSVTAENVKKAVLECAATSNAETSAQAYLKLVHLMRASTPAELKSVADSGNLAGNALEMFYDALVMTQTDASVDLLVGYLLKESSHAKSLLNSILLSSAFVSKPTVAMLKSLEKLLDKDTYHNVALLAISTLHRKLCNQNPDCHQIESLPAFHKRLEADFKAACEQKNSQKVVMHLKALGNIGKSLDLPETLTSLSKCINAMPNDRGVRLATYDALRSFPCDETITSYLLNAYEVQEKDTEARIKAYQSLMQCPTDSILETIVESLKKEENQQVGSFVWSHLNAQIYSSNPFKADLTNLLEKYRSALFIIGKDLNLDARSHSKYYESVFNVVQDVNGHAETSVVFGPDSFLPQHTRINITLNMYGRAVNLFDVGLTTQGLDESFLQMQNYLLRTKGDQIEKKLLSSEKVKDLKFKPKQQPSIAVSIKVFGHEISFQQNILDKVNPVTLLNQLRALFSVDFNLKRNFFLSESVLTFPAMSGFPVHLQMSAAAAIDFTVAASLQRTPYLKVETNLKPKFSVYSIGRFFVNAPTMKVGLFAEYNIHSNLTLGTGAEFRSGDLQAEGLRWRVFMAPVTTRQSLISLKRNVNQYRDDNQPSGLIVKPVKVKTQKSICTGDATYSILGAKVCVAYLTLAGVKDNRFTIAYEVNIEKFAGYVLHLEYLANAGDKLLPRSFIFKTGYEALAARLVLLNLTDISSGAVSGYNLEVKMPLFGQYGLQMTAEDNKVYKGILRSSGKDMAEVTGFVDANKILWRVQQDKMDIAVFSLERLPTGRTMKFELKKRVPISLKYVYTGNMTSTQAFTRGRHAFSLELPNDNEFAFSTSTTDSQKVVSNVNEGTLSARWKSKDVVVFDYQGKYALEMGQSKSANLPEVSGKLFRVEITHDLKGRSGNWDKNWGISTNVHFFVSDSIYNPVGYAEPRLAEVYLNWLNPKSQQQSAKYSFVLRMDPPSMLTGNYTLESIATLPNTTAPIRRKFQLAWRKNPEGGEFNFEILSLVPTSPNSNIIIQAYHRTKLPEMMKTDLLFQALGQRHNLRIDQKDLKSLNITLELNTQKYELRTLVTQAGNAPGSSKDVLLTFDQDYLENNKLVGKASTTIEYGPSQGGYMKYNMTYYSVDGKMRLATEIEVKGRSTFAILWKYRNPKSFHRVQLKHTFSTSDAVNDVFKRIDARLEVSVQLQENAIPYLYNRSMQVFTEQHLFYIGAEYSGPKKPKKDAFVFYVSNGFTELKFLLQQASFGQMLYRITNLPATRQPSICETAHVVDSNVEIKIDLTFLKTPLIYEVRKSIQRETGCSSMSYLATGSFSTGKGWKDFEYSFKHVFNPENDRLTVEAYLQHDSLKEAFQWKRLQLDGNWDSRAIRGNWKLKINAEAPANSHNYQGGFNLNKETKSFDTSLKVECPHISLQSNGSLVWSDQWKVLGHLQWNITRERRNFFSGLLSGSKKSLDFNLVLKSSIAELKDALVSLRAESQPDGGVTVSSNVAILASQRNFTSSLRYTGGTGLFQWDSNLFSWKKGNFRYSFTQAQQRRLFVSGEILQADSRVVTQWELSSVRLSDWSRCAITFSLLNRAFQEVTAEFSLMRQPEKPFSANASIHIPNKFKFILKNLTVVRDAPLGKAEVRKFIIDVDTTYDKTGYTYYAEGKVAFSDLLEYFYMKSLRNGKVRSEYIFDLNNRTFKLYTEAGYYGENMPTEYFVALPVLSSNNVAFEGVLQVGKYIRRSTLRLDYFNGYTTGETKTNGKDGTQKTFYTGVDFTSEYETAKSFHLSLSAAKGDAKKYQVKLYHDIDMKALSDAPLKGSYGATVQWDGTTLETDLEANDQKTHKVYIKWETSKMKIKISKLKSSLFPVDFEAEHENWFPIKWNLKWEGTLESKGDFKDAKAFLLLNIVKLGQFEFIAKKTGSVIVTTLATLKSATSDLQLNFNTTFRANSGQRNNFFSQLDGVASLRYSAWECSSCELRHFTRMDSTGFELNWQSFQNNLERLRLNEKFFMVSRGGADFRHTLELKYLALVDVYVLAEHFANKNATFKVNVRTLSASLDLFHDYETRLTSFKWKGAGFATEIETNLLRLVINLATKSVYDAFPVGLTYVFKVGGVSFKLVRDTATSVKTDIFLPKNGAITSVLEWKNEINSCSVTWNLSTPWKSVKQLKYNSNYVTEREKIKATFNVNLNTAGGQVYDNQLDLTYQTRTLEVKNSYKAAQTYSVVFSGSLSLYDFTWDHSLEVKDVAYDRMLISSKSRCEPMSLLKKGTGVCRLESENNARTRVLSFERTSASCVIEMAWNKKDLGFLRYERKGSRQFSFKTPVRNIELQISEIGYQAIGFVIKTNHPIQTDKEHTFSVDLKSRAVGDDLVSEALFNSNMLNKPLKLSFRAGFSEEQKYTVTLNMAFGGSPKPFFSAKLQGYASFEYNFVLDLLVDLNDKSWNGTFTLQTEGLFRTRLVLYSPQNTEVYEFTYNSPQQILIKAANYFKYEMTTVQEDFVTRVRSSLRLQPSDQSVDMLLEHGTNPLKWVAYVNTSEMSVGLSIRTVSQRAIRGDLVRTKKGGERIQDASLSIILDKDDFLRTEVNWRKGIWADYQALALRAIDPASLKRIYDYYVNLAKDRRANFLSQFGKPFVDAMAIGRIIDYMKSIANDVDQLGTIIQTLYDEDDFYLKTIFQGAGNSAVFRALTNLPRTLCSSILASGEAFQAFSLTVEELLKSVYEVAQRLAQKFDTETVKKWISSVVQWIRSVREKISTTLKEIVATAERLRNQALESSGDLPGYVQSKLEALFSTEFRNYVTQLTRRVAGMLLSFKDKFLNEWYKNQVNKLVAFQKEMRHFASELEKLRAARNATSSSKTPKENLRQILSLIAQGKYSQAYDALFRPNQTRIEVDMDKGQVLMLAYVSPVFRGLGGQLRSYYKYLPRQLFLSSKDQGRMVERLYYYIDYVSQRYGSYEDIIAYWPPFSKSAWITNNLHYTSFDGASGYLQKECEATLVKDILGNRFSLKFHISADGISTMKITVGSKTYQLLSNGKFLTSSSKSVALPYLEDDFIFVRREGQLVRAVIAGGLQVELHTASRLWRVQAAGALHGNLNGLLGTNNFHRNDDYALADGSVSSTNTNAARLNSWSSGVCSADNNVADFPRNLQFKTERDSQCEKLFSGYDSHLSRCFFAVDPRPYLQLCRYPASDGSINTKRHVCDIERSYVAACLAISLSVRVRKECVECLGQAKEDTITTVDKDRFIFLVEDAPCFTNRKSFISKLADGLSAGKATTMFSLLQFSDNSFHTVTMSHGGLEGSVDDFKSALDRISSTNANSTSVKTMGILEEAINLPTSPTYRDQIILFGCSSCAYGNQNVFAKVSDLLQKNGIAFHYFTSASFSSLDVKNVVGMDQNNIYRVLPGGATDVKSRDKEMRPTKDSCGPLALDSKGSIWSLDDSTATLKALTQINRRIKWSSEATAEKQTCTCRADKYGNGEIECRHPLTFKS